METKGNTWATRAGRPVEKPVSNRGRKRRESGPEAETAKDGEIHHESGNDKGRA